MADDPWADLVMAAIAQIHSANTGNTLVAREVIAQAAVGLREVVAGRTPDPERLEYLKYILDALDQIIADVPAEKALGLWLTNRPHAVPADRDLVLFVATGNELDRIRTVGIASTEANTRPISAAITRVAAQFNTGQETVRKAWTRLGGEDAWTKAKSDEGEESPAS